MERGTSQIRRLSRFARLVPAKTAAPHRKAQRMSNDLLKELLPFTVGMLMLGSTNCYSAKWKALRITGAVFHILIVVTIATSVALNWDFVSSLPLDFSVMGAVIAVFMILARFASIKRKESITTETN